MNKLKLGLYSTPPNVTYSTITKENIGWPIYFIIHNWKWIRIKWK